MKITKIKEVIKEQIEVKPGTYYFKDENLVNHKFILEEPEEDYSEYILQTLHNFSDKRGIIIREEGAWDSEGLPYEFKQFILGFSGKEITEEEFEKEKQEVLKRL